MTFNRRQFLAAGAVLGATGALAQPTSPLPFLINMQSDPLLPKATGKRVVVCGGGWAYCRKNICSGRFLFQSGKRKAMSRS